MFDNGDGNIWTDNLVSNILARQTYPETVIDQDFDWTAAYEFEYANPNDVSNNICAGKLTLLLLMSPFERKIDRILY